MKLKNLAILVLFMLIGEVVFILPFVLVRIFRPTFLTVFELTNLQLGTAFSAYGVVAMLAYFAGGPLADRFNPRQLIPSALIATSLGGFYLYTIPTAGMLGVVYAFWGVSTILLFWSAFVKAQRLVGLQTGQGKSFGLVEAGRGLIAALMASSSVYLLEGLLPVSADLASSDDYDVALKGVILIYSVATLLCAGLVWLVLDNRNTQGNTLSLKGVGQVIRNKSIWQQAIILLCAYVGYKCTDDFSLYAYDTLGYNDVKSAGIAAITFWARPVAAIGCGVLADRWLTSKVVSWCFILIILGSLVLSSGVLEAGAEIFVVITIASTGAAIYGLRGIYYALFQESKIPVVVTGSAAGLVSVVGYTPDVFMGPLMGVILDNNPGPLGHQYLFAVLAAFSVVGLIASILFRKSNR